jgi:hypothetical protein
MAQSSDSDRTSPSDEVRRRRSGPGWFWKLAGLVGIGQPIVDRESMYGDDPRNDPYSQDFDPNRRDRR